MSPRSRYLEHLPAIFDDDWLDQYLRGFEAVLTGIGDVDRQGLEELLEGIDIPGARTGIERHFVPGPGLPADERAPDGFLEWLSAWVAVTLRNDAEPELQRRLIANAVELYGLRGTKDGLERLLAIYTGLPVSVADAGTGCKETGPHEFRVTVRAATIDALARTRDIVTSIIDVEKPAHTYYTLEVEPPVHLQIGDTSRIGLDTLLGANH